MPKASKHSHTSTDAKEERVAVTEQEFDQLREAQSKIAERQSRVEQNVETLAGTARQLVETTQVQQQSLSNLTSDVQSILTLLKATSGRLDIKMAVTVVGFILGIVGPVAVMFISPLKTHMDNLQTQQNQNTLTHRDDLRQLREEGAPLVRRKLDVYDERLSTIRSDIDRIDARQMQRLEAEAAIGRQFMYNTTPAAKKPSAKP